MPPRHTYIDTFGCTAAAGVPADGDRAGVPAEVGNLAADPGQGCELV